MNTEGVTIKFGKHKGELFTRLPPGYLRWMVQNETTDHQIARAELERRGDAAEFDIEISAHAIDRASLRLLPLYERTRKNQNEGLHTWLQRNALDAHALADGADTVEHMGVKWVFAELVACPVLKSVIFKGDGYVPR